MLTVVLAPGSARPSHPAHDAQDEIEPGNALQILLVGLPQLGEAGSLFSGGLKVKQRRGHSCEQDG